MHPYRSIAIVARYFDLFDSDTKKVLGKPIAHPVHIDIITMILWIHLVVVFQESNVIIYNIESSAKIFGLSPGLSLLLYPGSMFIKPQCIFDRDINFPSLYFVSAPSFALV
jgi:hypothetical protein